ncbi:FXYD domain-containing ion transport regulator 3-like [Cuculus canorus]|uniref:FXYD domain-containing ion transport regulator 3-like n=1 Tax=Cuculus canorus TaxID=55661 RepID=UPI0023AAFAEB|nr:FXYD domain-containing ion transport regulator 3-like [Cuculus canorus]
MMWSSVGAVVLLAVVSLVRGDPLPPDATNRFQYDWHRLRVAGMAVASVLAVTGVIVLLSGKCKCRSKSSHRRPPPLSPPLLDPGATSAC